MKSLEPQLNRLNRDELLSLAQHVVSQIIAYLFAILLLRDFEECRSSHGASFGRYKGSPTLPFCFKRLMTALITLGNIGSLI
jgi:hypothetical protein